MFILHFLNVVFANKGNFSKGKLASGKYQQLNKVLSNRVTNASFDTATTLAGSFYNDVCVLLLRLVCCHEVSYI
jgi:hypothetical protein